SPRWSRSSAAASIRRDRQSGRSSHATRCGRSTASWSCCSAGRARACRASSSSSRRRRPSQGGPNCSTSACAGRARRSHDPRVAEDEPCGPARRSKLREGRRPLSGMRSMTLRRLLGIELPIIQAPMAGVQGSELAVAVSNAGGLGSLPCAMLSPDAIRDELQTIRAQTDRPFNVNFFCHALPEPSAEREAGWRAALSPYYREFGIDMSSIPDGPGRAPFDRQAADLLEAFRPAVVSFHFGLPSAALIERVKSWGSKIFSSATTVEEARWLEAHGADAIIAQ